MSKHTKGPWQCHRNHHYWQFGTDEFQLGDVCATQFTDPGAEEANARLIAAAPELLEACLRLVGSLGVMIGDPDNDGDIVFVRAAIAKATGENPNA
jgi:hypothetical protein